MNFTGHTVLSSFPSSSPARQPSRAFTVISTSQINKLRLGERGLAQGHKARKWRDHPAQKKNPRRLCRGLGPTPPTTWVRFRRPRSGRKRPIWGIQNWTPSSLGHLAGPQGHVRPTSRHTPQARASPLPRPPPRPPAPTQRCAAEEGGAGSGRGVHLRRCPSEGRVNGGRRGAKRQAPPPAPGKGNQLLGAELCSPPPEPEVAPRPEAGNGRGNWVPRRGGVGRRGLSRPWRCPVAPWS